MIDYDAELKKYSKVSDLEDVEQLVKNKDLTDKTDIMKYMIQEKDEQI